MKILKTLVLCWVPIIGFSQKIITSDIENFWNAYDKIMVEKDSVKQLNLIQTLYINKGTPGLDGIMRARRYSAPEYVFAINHYPKFWQSIRKNTLKSKEFSKDIQKAIDNLKKIYPDLKPVNIYFEIGILRTGGTSIDGMSLIGSEVAMADESTVTTEFDETYPHLRNYFNTNPIEDVVFLNVHEYIHTQQKETIGNSLLSQTLMEGVAEFLAEIALNQKSPNPQIEFGFKNETKIKAEFEKEMFSPNIYNWIMNSPENQFKMRDLGYFVGYAICKKYYENASDKKAAVKEMIELDYNNESDLIQFVEKTNYFEKSLSVYKKEFENSRPKVIGIQPFENGNQNVNPETKQITIQFSEQLQSNTSIDYGPLGKDFSPKITDRFWSEDYKSFHLKVELEPNKHYQLTIESNFRNANDFPLVPYLIDFKTSE